MKKKTDDCKCCMEHFHGKKGMKKHGSHGVASGVYCLGSIGAAIYFIQQATTFGAGVVGLLKAFVWPAFLIYNLLDFLKM